MANPPLIHRSPIAPDTCNLAKAFETIGDHWTLLILRSALYGLRRFDDFQADLGIPRSVLSQRLSALVDAGLVERRQYREGGQRPRTEYVLTAKGLALHLPFVAMTEWSDRWLADGNRQITLRSRTSGQVLRVAMIDEAGRRVLPTDIDIEIEPAARRSDLVS